MQEYGGVVEAARAFRADAAPADCRELAVELARLAEASADWSPAKLESFVTRTLGATWATASAAQLREMAAVLDV